MVKKHTGIDVNAIYSEPVYSSQEGIVRAIVDGGEAWAYGITIEHITMAPVYTTVYWHINPMIEVGDTVFKGEKREKK